MEKTDALNILRRHKDELDGILGRFKSGGTGMWKGIYIHQDDDPRFRQLVIELRDFLDDILGGNSYSAMIVNHFNKGIANFTESPSYKSVENIRGVISSVITRLERNSEILSTVRKTEEEKPSTIKTEPDLPDKVTLSWLLRHVPMSFWIAAVGLIASAFIAGIQASRISVVKEIFKL